MIAAKKQTQPNEYYDDIALELIDESPLNPRKTFGDLAPLKESIGVVGVIHPPLLRPSPTAPGRFELVCGHRRVRACRELGIKVIACVVREGIDDRHVVELMLIENSTREDVPAIEEAEAYALLNRAVKDGGFGMSLEQIADRVGKSLSHVTRRIRLNDLAPIVKQAVSDGVLLANAAAAISRLKSHDDQANVIADLLKRRPSNASETPTPATEADVRWAIERNLRELGNAPFDITDAKLVPAAGACGSCEKRTKAQIAMFPDDDDEDRCTDGACWRGKTHVFGLRAAEKSKVAKGLKILTPEEGAGMLDAHGYVDKKQVVDVAERVNPYTSSSAKWGDVVGDKLERVGVIDGDGELHVVVPTKDAKKLLPRGDKEAKGVVQHGHAPAARDLAAEAINQAVWQAMDIALLAAVVARAKKKQDVELFRFLAAQAAEQVYAEEAIKAAKKIKTVADAVVVIAMAFMHRAAEDGDSLPVASALLGAKEAKAITKKAEDDVLAKNAAVKDVVDQEPAPAKKAAKKKAKR